jgi:hypothetical protein
VGSGQRSGGGEQGGLGDGGFEFVLEAHGAGTGADGTCLAGVLHERQAVVRKHLPLCTRPIARRRQPRESPPPPPSPPYYPPTMHLSFVFLLSLSLSRSRSLSTAIWRLNSESGHAWEEQCLKLSKEDGRAQYCPPFEVFHGLHVLVVGAGKDDAAVSAGEGEGQPTIPFQLEFLWDALLLVFCTMKIECFGRT